MLVWQMPQSHPKVTWHGLTFFVHTSIISTFYCSLPIIYTLTYYMLE